MSFIPFREEVVDSAPVFASSRKKRAFDDVETVFGFEKLQRQDCPLKHAANCNYSGACHSMDEHVSDAEIHFEGLLRKVEMLRKKVEILENALKKPYLDFAWDIHDFDREKTYFSSEINFLQKHQLVLSVAPDCDGGTILTAFVSSSSPEKLKYKFSMGRYGYEFPHNIQSSGELGFFPDESTWHFASSSIIERLLTSDFTLQIRVEVFQV